MPTRSRKSCNNNTQPGDDLTDDDRAEQEFPSLTLAPEKHCSADLKAYSQGQQSTTDSRRSCA